MSKSTILQQNLQAKSHYRTSRYVPASTTSFQRDVPIDKSATTWHFQITRITPSISSRVQTAASCQLTPTPIGNSNYKAKWLAQIPWTECENNTLYKTYFSHISQITGIMWRVWLLKDQPQRSRDHALLIWYHHQLYEVFDQLQLCLVECIWLAVDRVRGLKNNL